LNKAADAYATAHRHEPDNPEYLGNLARARVQRGDRDEETPPAAGGADLA
jgi:cytochrome c-type biogenesis protein CcmH/NrfG